MTKPSLWSVIPAAGAGLRMQSRLRKQHLLLNGKTLLHHTVETLAAITRVDGVMVVLAADDIQATLPDSLAGTRVRTTIGGATRAESVMAGVKEVVQLEGRESWVMVHDAARPLVHADDVNRLINTVWQLDAVGGLLAVPVQDTLKRANSESHDLATVRRDDLWQAQTPQLFQSGLLLTALQDGLHAGRARAAESHADQPIGSMAMVAITDEASAMERAGHRPLLVEAQHPNLKITRPADMLLAQALLHAAAEQTQE